MSSQDAAPDPTSDPAVQPMPAQQLAALAASHHATTACPACGPLRCPGWESMPAGFDSSVLARVGSLRDPAVDEPTLDEALPPGLHRWSPLAPISPRHHPYNLCAVDRCRHCGRVYLRYTEYGGYYVDERVRLVDAALVVLPAAGPQAQ